MPSALNKCFHIAGVSLAGPSKRGRVLTVSDDKSKLRTEQPMKLILSSMLALAIVGSPLRTQEPDEKEKPKQQEPKKQPEPKPEPKPKPAQEPDDKAKPKPKP